MILKLPSLKYRRKRGDMIMMYKLMHGFMNISIDKFFTFNSGEMTLRGHNFKIFKPFAKTFVRRNCFFNRVIDDWNSLPYDIVNSVSINVFKNNLDKHWTNYHYEIPF